MSTATGAALSNAGLTVLSEDEEMFRASVRDFAEGEAREDIVFRDPARSDRGSSKWNTPRSSTLN